MWYLAVSLGEGELQASVGVTKPSVFVGAKVCIGGIQALPVRS